jgi:hypothetical protein
VDDESEIVMRNLPFFIFAVLVFPAESALATQAHGGIEGVYIHQASHLFFVISMAILIYWLRERELVRERGWRYIQYAALLFIIWNLDTILVHFLDDQLELIRATRVDTWQIRVQAQNGARSLEVFYYLAKLDHLLCVPALFFLYAGLKRLLGETTSDAPLKPPTSGQS